MIAPGIHNHLHGRDKLRAQQQISPASAAITAISDSALLMGCRCAAG